MLEASQEAASIARAGPSVPGQRLCLTQACADLVHVHAHHHLSPVFSVHCDAASWRSGFKAPYRSSIIDVTEVTEFKAAVGKLTGSCGAGVKWIVYTSSLHADTSTVEPLAQEDLDTEALMKESGIPFTILRNGSYTENHLQALEGSIAAGAFVGAAGPTAKFSCAPRSDYAAAAVEVLTGAPGKYEGKTLELAGDPDKAYTLPELAAEVAKQTGKPFPYQDLPREEYVKVLKSTGAITRGMAASTVPSPFIPWFIHAPHSHSFC
jgi:uncharacterized protein YbjT (DUF2867 family)